MQIKPKAGFDWARVIWGRPDSPRSVLCSYCSASFADDDVPLIMWTEPGMAAQFCEACQEQWWGMTSYSEGEPE